MEDHDDVVTRTSVSESTTVSEHMGCESQIERSLCEGDGGEIMVEVVGSDVFVDGVSGHDDGGGGDFGAKVGGDGLEKEGSEREMGGFDGGSSVSGDLMLREVGDSGCQVWVGGFQEIPGSLGEQANDVIAEEAGVVAGPSTELSQVVEDEVFARVSEDENERVLVEEDVERVMESVNAAVMDDEVLNSGTEASVIASSEVAGPSSAQTQAVADKAAVMVEEKGMSCKNDLEGGDVAEATLLSSGNGQSSEVAMVCLGNNKDCSVHENAEFLDQRTKAIGGEDGGVTNEEEILLSTVEVLKTDCSDQRTKAIGGEDGGVTNEEEILLSTVEVLKTDCSDQTIACSVEDQQMKFETAGKSTESDGSLDVGSLSSHEPTKAPVSGEVGAMAGMVSSNPDVDATKNAGLGGIGKDVGKVSIVRTESGSFIKESQVAEGYPAVADSQVSISDSGTQVCGGEEALTTENTKIGVSTKNSGYVEDKKLRIETTIENSIIGDTVDEEPESSNVQTPSVNDSEVKEMDGKVSSPKLDVPITDDMDGIAPCSEDLRMNGVVCAAPQSSYENPCVTERGEDAGMDIEEVLDFRDEGPGLDALDENLGCSERDQHLNVEKIDDCSENYIAHGHLESSGELTRIADSGDIAGIYKGVVPRFEVEAEMKNGQAIFNKLDSLNGDLYFSEVGENLKAATVRTDEGFVQADSGTYVGHVLVSERETPVMNEKNVSNSKTEVLDGDTRLQKHKLHMPTVGGSTEKVVGVAQANTSSSGEQTEGEIRVEISAAECQGIVEAPTSDDMDGNISLSSKENRLKVETVDGDKEDDSVVGKDIPLGTEVEDHPTSILGTKSYSPQENTDIQEWKQEAAAQLAETPIHEADQDQRVNPLNIDEISNQETGITTRSNTVVEAAAGSHATTHKCEGNLVSSPASDFAIPVPDGNQTSEVDVVSDNKVSVIEHQSNYLLPPENEDEFSVSDLLWGKVRSHPWWPGQIFDPADASEEAIKHHKNDSFLVAYFGDHTFAWNDASLLKPFRSHFSQIEKQSNSEAFHNAVRCAVEEISRRVELELTCSCMPQDAYDKIESQIFENTGIRQESSRRSGVDKSSGASSFEPDKLVEYIRALAWSPSGVLDRLELVIAKAQLSAFCSFSRYRQLPEFQFCGGLLESDAAAPQLIATVENASPVLMEVDNSFHKRKHNFEDIVYSRKKERSLSELMDDVTYSPEGVDCPDGKVTGSLVSPNGGKRKGTDSFNDSSDKRVSIYAAKVSAAASPIPKPSFKVGECIRRVASQLTGSPTILSPQTPENFQREITECSSLVEMLLQLQFAALDPMKGYNFLNTIVTFFSRFRSSVVLSQYSETKNSSMGRPGSGRKKKASRTVIGSPEEFEFDDDNDSYWTDRIIQNYSHEIPFHNGENGGREYQLVAFEPGKSLTSRRRSHSRKQYSTANDEMPAEEQTEYIDENKRALSPAELVMNFHGGNPVPSLIYLNKTFRRFGPLMESETEVDGATGHARLIFKRGSDAEVAFSSAGTFSIFGSVLVHYQLNYSPSIAYKPLPLAISEGREVANLMSLS